MSVKTEDKMKNKLIDSLLGKVSYLPEEDIEKIKETAEYIVKMHEGQKRKSGEPYYTHPIEVAKILAELRLDTPSIISALLHDVVEDVEDVSIDDIRDKFGGEVANIVDGVTKLDKAKFKSKEEAEIENFRKMIVSIARDFRVILVKIADRLHNMRTLEYMRREKQIEKAEETLQVYAPIAARVGLWKIKSELEDLSFKYLHPDEYKRIKSYIASTRPGREKFLKNVIQTVENKLNSENINAEISYRVKHLYSIYEKMHRKNLPINNIHDIFGVRIIVNTVQECYMTLGYIHQLWQPLEGRFKDYIANPKKNLYQALHTTVLVKNKSHYVEVEFQIKTKEMHEIAERGIAAHFRYKGGKYLTEEYVRYFDWVNKILKDLKKSDSETINDVKSTLPQELTVDHIYVFTPHNDIKLLPIGSTPVDFAYSVHTELGHRIKSAKVNGKLVPLDTELHSGDVVEIIKGKKANPKREWLSFVKSSKAKTNIKSFLRKKEKRLNLAHGKKLLDKFLRKVGKTTSSLTEKDKDKLVKKFNLKSFEDLVEKVGAGHLSPAKILTAFTEGTKTSQTKKSGKKASSREEIEPIIVDGQTNILAKISNCCNPIPGEEIVGIVTKGKISVHSKDCPNIQYILEKEKERVLPTIWNKNLPITYPVRLRLITEDKPGILASITDVLAKHKINIENVSSRGTSSKKAIINFKIDIKDLEQLNKVINHLKRIKGILTVERLKTRK